MLQLLQPHKEGVEYFEEPLKIIKGIIKTALIIKISNEFW